MALLQSGVAIEVIALYLGHASPKTTHGYIEADLKMKAECLRRLTEPKVPNRIVHNELSRLLAFLESVSRDTLKHTSWGRGQNIPPVAAS
jgi:integrase/recombinase XerD